MRHITIVLVISLVMSLLGSSQLFSQDNSNIIIVSVDWSDNFEYIAAVGANSDSSAGFLHVLSASDGTLIHSIEFPFAGLTALDWSPNGNFIAIGSYDQTIKVFDINSETIAANLVGHRWAVNSLDWDTNGNRLISGSPGDNRVILWDMNTYTSVNSLVIDNVWSVAFSPTNEEVAVGGGAGLFVLPSSLAINSQEQLDHFKYANGNIGALAWNNDGSKVVFGTQTFNQATTRISILDTRSRIIERSIEPQVNAIYGIAWNPANTEIAAYSLDGFIGVWDVETGALLDSFTGNSEYLGVGLGFSAYGGRLAYGTSIRTLDQRGTAAFEDSGVAMVVPSPSIEKLNVIAEKCGLRNPNTVTITVDELDSFTAQLDALPNNAATVSCVDDLSAIADALVQ